MGLTENSFKTRFANHKSSFRDPNKRLSTELSKHIWHLKDSKLEFKITWKILKQTVPFNPALNCCNLCLWEKYFIICRPDVSFSIPVRWSIYIINSVDKPNFRVSLPHQRSTPVSSETNPLYSFITILFGTALSAQHSLDK